MIKIQELNNAFTMVINKNLMIDNIKANIRYIKNTEDEYDIKYNDEILDGELTIDKANFTDGDTVEAIVRSAKTSRGLGNKNSYFNRDT